MSLLDSLWESVERLIKELKKRQETSLERMSAAKSSRRQGSLWEQTDDGETEDRRGRSKHPKANISEGRSPEGLQGSGRLQQ